MKKVERLSRRLLVSMALLVPATGDISAFNVLMPGELQFFRFEVEFNLDAMALGDLTNVEPVALDFMRIPFRF